MDQEQPDTLHMLAYKGDFETVKVKVIVDNKWVEKPKLKITNFTTFLPFSREVTKADESGRTLMHWAVSGGRTEIVEWLLEHQSPFDTPDDSKY